MLVASVQGALLPFAIAYAGGCGLVGALGYYHITQAVAARTARPRGARAGHHLADAVRRLAAVDERDTTCCYARQDKFWVTGAPGGERWEIYTILEDSPTFWGHDAEQRWDAVQAELDTPAGQATQCCGGPQATGQDAAASSGACCV